MTHATVTRTPTATKPAGLRAVVRAHDPAERMAERFADAVVSGELPFTDWAFADVPLHDPSAETTVDATLTGSGRPLDPATATRLGTPLGTDLSALRVHDSAEGADLARRAGADAVTVGTDVAFAPGRYEPATPEGLHRIAHEAAHVARPDRDVAARRNGSGAVAPTTTLDGLPEADRKKVRDTTTTAIEVTGIDAKFSTKGGTVTLGLPADTTVNLDATVDKKLQHGMDNIAAALTTDIEMSPAPLKENATVTLNLDLSKVGGINGMYRFTYHVPKAVGKAKPAKRILVEQLGTPTAVPGQVKPPEPKPGATAPPDAVADKIKAHGFSQSYSGAELEALRAAISEIPDSQLSIVDGLKFARDAVHPTEPVVAGNYDPKTHTVTMFDRAFAPTQVVFQQGTRATSAATRAIIHEIGHAIDLQPIRKATLAKTAADTAVAALPRKYPDPKNKDGWRWTNQAEKKDIDATRKAQKDAEEALLKTKSRSGTTTAKDRDTGDIKDVIGTAADSDYRKAAAADGVPVSKYAEKDWQENYAEAYSLFHSTPDTLKTLRPKTFDYLDKNLPK
jgi:hypothetical protein